MHKRVYKRFTERYPSIQTALAYLAAPEDRFVSRRVIGETRVDFRDLDKNRLSYVPTDREGVEYRVDTNEFRVEFPEFSAVSRISRSVVVVEWADGTQITTTDLNGHEDDHGDESPCAEDGSKLAELFLERGDVKYVVLCTMNKDSLVEIYDGLATIHVAETHRRFDVTVLVSKMTPDALMQAAAEVLPPEVVERHEQQNHEPVLGDTVNPSLREAMYALASIRNQ